MPGENGVDQNTRNIELVDRSIIVHELTES